MYTLACRVFVAVSLAGILCASGQYASCGDKPKESREEAFYRECIQKLDEPFFTSRDLHQADRMMKQAGKEDEWRYTLLLARYYRRVEGKPAWCLRTLAPYLLAKDQRKTWEKAFDEKEREAVRKWKDACREARKARKDKPPKPNDLFEPWPAVEEWKVDPRHKALVVEAARAYIDMKAYPQALRILKHFRDDTEDFANVLALEAGGDLLVHMSQFSDAMNFYKQALKSFGYVTRYGKSPLESYVASRIHKRIKETQRLLDIARYGEGYVLYAEAEALRRQAKNYPLALMKYAEIRERFPQTIYAEASGAYSIRCMLALSSPDQSEYIRDAERKLREEIRWQSRSVTLAEKFMPKSETYQKRKAKLEGMEKRLAWMEALPSPKETVKKATALSEAFLSENEFGPYRGEVLVLWATRSFEIDLDPKEADTRFRKAWDWLQKVESVDADLASFVAPPQAREVTAAPEEEYKMTRMGKAQRQAPRIGALVNRRTCPWYLNDLREQCALAIGFLHFTREETEEARAWYAKAIHFDKKTGGLESRGEWNDYRRLKWGAEHGYLYAYPQELKLYNDRARLAILLGDFRYCTERFQEAETMYSRLLAGEFGRLSPAERDYPLYAIGACQYWTKGREAACRRYAEVLAQRDRTYTEIRAAYALGHVGQKLEDEKLRALAEKHLRDLARSGKDDEFVFRAMIQHARHLLAAGKTKEGLHFLGRVPKEADGYYELAQRFIQRSRESTQNSRGSR